MLRLTTSGLKTPPTRDNPVNMCLSLHLYCECGVYPSRFTLTAEQCHDITQASALIIGYTCDYVIADAAYDSDAFRAKIAAQGAVVVIHPRRNRLEDIPYDKEFYKLRNVVERFLSVEAVLSGCYTLR